MTSSIGSPLLWGGFTLLILSMFVLDLGVFHRKAHAIRPREALVWVLICVGLAALFNLCVWRCFGSQKALEFLTGYLIEEALSIDNLFVFMVVFSSFSVPPAYQHRVLFWGIVGALVMRGIFIVVGAALIHTFHWVVFIFGGFLVITGVKFLSQKETRIHPQQNPVLRLFRRITPVVLEYHGSRFTVVLKGRRYATLLLLVLVVVEATDVVFAIDSIPAVFAVTTDPFIVYTSNIFAILGLRALYFLLANAVSRFHYLKIGLGCVLIFVGAKMLVSEYYVVPVGLSLGVISGLLGLSIIASLLRKPVGSSCFSATS